jgi:transposase
VLEAVVWRYRTGSPWRDLPERFGPWQSVYDRHVRWSRDGTYDRLLAAAHTAADATGELDWLVAADSSLMRVHQHGATARRSSGNAATVSVGHGVESCDDSQTAEVQVGDLVGGWCLSRGGCPARRAAAGGSRGDVGAC